MIDRPDAPDTGWARDIAALEDAQIKARLGNLSVERQVDLFLTLDWKQRLRIVRNSRRAAEIVRALPEQEVLLTIKGAGEEDSLPLVALTTPAQLRFVLDIELWARDTVDDEKARLWLRYILGCGERKMIQFVENTDRELLIVMLAKLIKLVPYEEGVKVPEGLPSIMPDEFFTILSNVPEETENLRLLMRILRQWNRNEFYKLLFQVHGSVDAETEENAFRWRTSRLEEKGLVEFDEAIEIYGYIGEDEAKAAASSAPAVAPSAGSAGAAPVYPVLLADRKTFFYRVLTSIDEPSVQNRLRTEIAFAANRLLVADARMLGDIDSMRAALNRLFAFVNVALLFLTGGSEREAAVVLGAVPIKELFQIGFSRAADLKSIARSIAWRWWPHWEEKGFIFLDYPYDEVMKHVLLRVPQYLPFPKGGGIHFRDFETLDEVNETRRMLDEIGAVAEACFDKLGIPRPHEAEPELGTVFAAGVEEIDCRNLMLTGFVNFATKDRFEITPLTRRDIQCFFERVLDLRASGERLVSEGARAAFLSWLSATTGFEEDRQVLLDAFFEAGVEVLEQEIGKVPSWEDLDPRYVGTLIFSRSYGQDER
jgi:hypothetical protein